MAGGKQTLLHQPTPQSSSLSLCLFPQRTHHAASRSVTSPPIVFPYKGTHLLDVFLLVTPRGSWLPCAHPAPAWAELLRLYILKVHSQWRTSCIKAPHPQGSETFKTALPTGDHVFHYVSLWGWGFHSNNHNRVCVCVWMGAGSVKWFDTVVQPAIDSRKDARPVWSAKSFVYKHIANVSWVTGQWAITSIYIAVWGARVGGDDSMKQWLHSLRFCACGSVWVCKKRWWLIVGGNRKSRKWSHDLYFCLPASFT